MTNDSELNKSLEAHKEAVSVSENNILHAGSVKSKLSSSLLSGSDLKLYLLMTCGTYNAAAAKAGITSDRLHQICMGYSVPENPDILKSLARAWNIDLVIITQLFDRLREAGQ